MKSLEFTADGVNFKIYSEPNGDVRIVTDIGDITTDGVYLSPGTARILGEGLILMANGEKDA